MYLSSLLIDTGDNPDRPRPGRTWLRNLYHVHQRLCMAFPSASRKSDDKDFLKPYKPVDFGDGQVHVTRKTDSGFLFRIDPLPGGRVVIVVQSAIEPDWDYAFRNSGHLLSANPDVRLFEPSFESEQRLKFRLVANPTKKIGTAKKKERQNCTKEEWKEKRGRHGKRVPVPTDKLLDWLDRQAKSKGFSIVKDSTIMQPGYVDVNKRGHNKQHLCSVRFEGVLTVTDPASFLKTIVSGIGSGKAFGFGLLSVVPVNSSVREEQP